jgi:hypothetical protein
MAPADRLAADAPGFDEIEDGPDGPSRDERGLHGGDPLRNVPMRVLARVTGRECVAISEVRHRSVLSSAVSAHARLVGFPSLVIALKACRGIDGRTAQLEVLERTTPRRSSGVESSSED